MAKKNNIRSIRFSDELAELIERQAGDSFTEKFENLVTRCVWELPEKERQIKEAEKQLKAKRKELGDLQQKAWDYAQQLNSMKYNMVNITRAIEKLTKLDK